MIRRRRAAVLLALVGLAAAAPSPDLPDLPLRSFTLENGLQVVIHEDHRSPRVALHLLARSGAAWDPPGGEGTAHLLEHLAFRVTPVPGEGHWDDHLAACGGEGNAWTDREYTAFYVVVPRGCVERALWLEAARLGGLAAPLPPADVDAEREVVRTERALLAEDPRAVDLRWLDRLLYPGHAYGRSILGTTGLDGDSLDAVGPAEVAAFARRHLAPHQLSLVVAGDVDAAEAEAAVRRHLAVLPAAPPEGVAALAAVPELAGEARRVREAPVAAPVLYVGWRTVPAGHADSAILAVAARVLSSGRGSRLDDALRYGGGARSTEAWTTAFGAGGSLVVRVAEPPTGLAGALEVVDREVARLAAEGPAPAELERIAASWEGTFLRGLEPLERRAALLQRCLAARGTAACLSAELAGIRAVGPEDVRRVVGAWLVPQRRVVLSVVPPGGAAEAVPGSVSLEETAVVAAPPLAEAKPHAPTAPEASPLAAPSPPTIQPLDDVALPPIRVARLAGGAPVFVVERHDVPLVRVEVAVQADVGAEAAGETLARQLAGLLLDEGSSTRDAAALEAGADMLGGILATAGGPLRNQVRLEVPARHLAPAVALLGEVLVSPAFPEGEVTRVRDAWVEAWHRAPYTPGRLLQLAEVRAVYPQDHPLGRLPDLRDHEALTRGRVARIHRRLLREGAGSVVVVGDTTLEAVLPLLEDALPGLRGAGGTATLPPPPDPARGARVVVLDDPGATLVHVVRSVAGPGPGAEGYAAHRLAVQVLSGRATARLGARLREEGGAYGVHGSYQGWPGHGRFRLETAVHSATLGRAVEAVLGEHVRVAGALAPVTADEVTSARAALLLEAAARLGTLEGVAAWLSGRAAIGEDPAGWRAEVAAIRRAGLEDVQAAAAALLDPARATWVVLGDRDVVEPALEQVGLYPTDLWSPGRVVEGAGE